LTTCAASISFPRIAKNNLITLSGDAGTLDFGMIPFFWTHAIASVRELDGTVLRSDPPIPAERRALQWQELKWVDRARIVMGFGGSVGR
jgi:hypothetical protein